MARSSKQKLKLLYLLQFLRRESDQEHPVTVQQMIDELEQFSNIDVWDEGDRFDIFAACSSGNVIKYELSL